MALSDHEQKVLSELEKQFRAEEPQLVAAFEQTPDVPHLTPARLAASIAGAILGVAVILGGVMAKSVIVGALGFAVLVIALYSVFGRGERGRLRRGSSSKGAFRRVNSRVSAPVSGRAGGKQAQAKPKSSFMRRLEDRWDERRGY